MKKILSLLLSVVMVLAMSITAFAAVVEQPAMLMGDLRIYTNVIEVDDVNDLDAVYETWKTGDAYEKYELIMVKGDITISKSYDFTKDNGVALSFRFRKTVTINEGATFKADGIEFTGTATNNGTIILTQPDNQQGAFSALYKTENSQGLTNNGTIQMLNTDIIVCYSDTVDKYPIINNGVIQTPSGKANYTVPYDKTNTNGDVYLNPASSGTIKKLPQIKDPDTTAGSDVTLSATTIPAPTYTVTIPKTIDFGTCEKAMANDTAENRIKEIAVDDLTITHSNLFVNEKKITVTMSSDFTIKNGENALSFDLFDGATELATNAVLITANPTAEDTAVNDNKSLTAKLDKTQIKKSGTYQGTVTFTVAMLDIA